MNGMHNTQYTTHNTQYTIHNTLTQAQRQFRRLMRRVLLYGAAGGVGAGLLYAAYKLYYKPSEQGAAAGEGSSSSDVHSGHASSVGGDA